MHPIIGTSEYKGITIEVIDMPELFFAGKLAYADNLTDEPDINGLHHALHEDRSLEKITDKENPDWFYAVSIDYWRNGAVPRGFLIGVETSNRNQPAKVDVYVNPASLYVRAKYDKNDPRVLDFIGEKHEGNDPWRLFGPLKEDWAPMNGFALSERGAQEFEVYASNGDCYAYVPIEAKPDGSV